MSLFLIWVDLRDVGENGIFGGVVECVDIRRNISGEGGFLDIFWVVNCF